MADKKTAGAASMAPVAAEKTVEAKSGGKNAVRFPVARLRADCLKLFGVTTSTFDGATCVLTGHEEYTVEEMGAIIKKWLGTPIGPAKKGGR